MTTNVTKSVNIPINGGYNPIRYPSINNETMLNLFDYEQGIISTPGFKEIVSEIASASESRGIFYSVILQRYVVVIGNSFFACTDEHSTLLGNLDSLSGKVFIAENGLSTSPNSTTGDPGAQIAVSDGENVYVYTLDDKFEKAKNDAGDTIDFKPGTIVFQNGFFFVNDLNNDRIYASAINNALSFPSDQFDFISGRTVTCAAFKNLLYVFSKDGMQPFYGAASSAGDIFFPYSPDINRAWEYGCLSANSFANSLGTMAWLGNSRYSNPVIMASNGSTPKAISTPGIDSLINNFVNPGDSDGFIYEVEGHTFYQINFNTDKFSLLYDFFSKKWARLSHFNENSLHPIRQTASYENKNILVGIRNDKGSVNEISLDIFTQDDRIMPRSIITKNYTRNERPITLSEVDLQMEQGENKKTTKVCFSVSKDRGRTYHLYHIRQLEPVGQRESILRFRKFGQARWWTFKMDFFSENRIVILKLDIFAK